MIDVLNSSVVCAQQVEVAMKRHRGQPLPLEKKLQIVGELLQQRKEREALTASRAAARSDARRHITDRHRASLFGRSVDNTNSIIVSIVNSKKNKTVAHNQKERRQTKEQQNFAPHSVVTAREMVLNVGKSTDERNVVRTCQTLSLSECFYFRSSINSFH
jgi:hypothetical protein